MSTRGIIARTTGTEGSFKGVYNHSDSYPTWMGPHIWQMLHGTYKSDVAEMLRCVIDQHSSGWSILGERCYCHPASGLEGESEDFRTNENFDESDTDIEWLWVFDVETNRLFVRDVGHHEDVAIIDLTGPEPDWTKIECGEDFRRCSHYA